MSPNVKKHELADDEKENVELTIKPKPIKLFITSHGGAIYAALQVVDVIHSLKVDVHTIVVGYVASAGTLNYDIAYRVLQETSKNR